MIHQIVGSWDLGSGYRYAPGARVSGPSANVAGQRCQALSAAPYLACLSDHHLQEGEFYLTANHYWEVQWKESALLLLTAGALLGLTVDDGEEGLVGAGTESSSSAAPALVSHT